MRHTHTHTHRTAPTHPPLSPFPPAHSAKWCMAREAATATLSDAVPGPCWGVGGWGVGQRKGGGDSGRVMQVAVVVVGRGGEGEGG